MARYYAKGAAGVLMDATNGEIIAMVSLPDFDPNNRNAFFRQGRAEDSPLFNRAAQGLYELGSVYKIFTAAMLMETGIATPDTMMDTRGPLVAGRFRIRDSHKMDPEMSLRDIITYSSNVGTARFAMIAGAQRQRAFLEKLGLLVPTPVELSEAAGAKPLLPDKWRDLSTMTISFGHGISGSPLHLASAYASLVNGGLTGKTLVKAFHATARNTAMIFFIVLGAAFYNGFLALSQLPQELSEWVVGLGFSPYAVLVCILLLYLVFGCLMDSLSMILLTVPIFFPIVSQLDFGLVSLAAMQADAAREVLAAGVPDGVSGDMLDAIRTAIASGAELTREQMQSLGIRITPVMARRIEAEEVAIWFGILVLIVVEVGLITPPVGMNLFVINSMDPKTRLVDTYKAVLPFVASDIVRVAILVAFPGITLFLLRLLH